MARLQKTCGAERAGRRGFAVFAALLPSLLLLSQTGCQHHQQRSDPLFGDRTPSEGRLNEAQATKTRSVPAIPTATTSPSTAALAAEPLPGARPPLRIEDPQSPTNPTPGNDWRAVGGPNGPAPGVVAVNPGVQPAAGAVLQRPQPMPTPPPVNTQPGVPVPGQNSPMTYEQLQDQLKARNVVWQRQDNTADGIRFSCAVPNSSNPNIQRVYEATAPTYLAAIRAVLDQIDQQR
jgi:hypothetical protein